MEIETGPGILAKTRLRCLRERPQRKAFCARNGFGMKVAAGFLLEGDACDIAIESPTFSLVVDDRTETRDEKNLQAWGRLHGISAC